MTSVINTDTFFDLIDVQVPTTTVAHGGRGGGGGRGRRRRKKSVAQQTVQGCHGHFVRPVRAIGGGCCCVVIVVLLLLCCLHFDYDQCLLIFDFSVFRYLSIQCLSI